MKKFTLKGLSLYELKSVRRAYNTIKDYYTEYLTNTPFDYIKFDSDNHSEIRFTLQNINNKINISFIETFIEDSVDASDVDLDGNDVFLVFSIYIIFLHLLEYDMYKVLKLYIKFILRSLPFTEHIGSSMTISKISKLIMNAINPDGGMVDAIIYQYLISNGSSVISSMLTSRGKSYRDLNKGNSLKMKEFMDRSDDTVVEEIYSYMILNGLKDMRSIMTLSFKDYDNIYSEFTHDCLLDKIMEYFKDNNELFYLSFVRKRDKIKKNIRFNFEYLQYMVFNVYKYYYT